MMLSPFSVVVEVSEKLFGSCTFEPSNGRISKSLCDPLPSIVMGVLPVFVMVMPAGTKNVPMVDIVLTVALSNVMTSPGASVGLARMP